MEQLARFAADYEGHPVELMPWDYAYYNTLELDRRYGYNSELLRPYFPLDSVIKGVFGLATSLYGLQFTVNPDAEVFLPP